MKADSRNFSILVENEEQFNRVWAYVRLFNPNGFLTNYQKEKPIAITLYGELGDYSVFFHDYKHYTNTTDVNIRITWEQFLEYEKEVFFNLMKGRTEKPLNVSKEIVKTIQILNKLIKEIPDNEAFKLTFNSEGDDCILYLDNLTQFTSVKSIYNSKELLNG